MTKAERKADRRAAYEAFIKCYPFTPDNLDGEIWRTVDGFDKYHVSNFGRVKSLWYGREKILKPSLVNNGKGYLAVKLFNDVESQTFQVHRLVAITFLPNPDNLPEVDHAHGITFDNSVWNLRWVTRLENMRSAFDMGLVNTPRGEDAHKAKLTNEQVEYVRNNPDGLNLQQLAEKFGVDFTAISLIQLGKTYKNAGGTVREKIERTGAKLDAAQVLYIRNNPDGLTVHELAEKFNVDATTISHVQIGKKYKDIGGQIRPVRKRTTITDDLRGRILAAHQAGNLSYHALAKMFGVDDKTIKNILNGK